MTSDTPIEELRKKVEAGEKAEKKTYKKRKKKSDPAYTKEGILALLKLPFQMGGAFTGFVNDPIDPLIADPLAEAALQVLKDFGIEVVQRWINLAVFTALYGSCGVTWYRGLQDFQVQERKKFIEMKKAKNGVTENTESGTCPR